MYRQLRACPAPLVAAGRVPRIPVSTSSFNNLAALTTSKPIHQYVASPYHSVARNPGFGKEVMRFAVPPARPGYFSPSDSVPPSGLDCFLQIGHAANRCDSILVERDTEPFLDRQQEVERPERIPLGNIVWTTS